jgi:CubicO group peptidase (beta-lactamase class C family)
MAIERLAIFALSVSFTTSLILYPDLPPDIPPRAGRYGPFVGGPFIAFFLPTTAIAVWWILAALNRAPRPVASGVVRAGAVTTLFLSAFHLIMVVAFVGDHPWLVRVLGALVGVFLIVTGNDLPRARPSMMWGGPSGSADDSDPTHVWRFRRVVGYVRVATGLALSSAALLGVPGFWRLMILAAGAESVLRVAAGLFARRVRHAVASSVVISFAAVGAIAKAQEIPLERIEALPPFVDNTMPKLMEAGHVPGSAVAVVYQGRVLLLRGYGHSQLEPDARVDPVRTAFRIGSVSKTLTALAVLQLVDARMLDLQRDVREYLPDVPLRYGATMHQLLTHTAGLDERFAGAYTDSPEHLEMLSEHVRRHPPEQFIPPGSVYSYSNYHYALAGAVIERLTGVRYEQYVADRVFRPLGMAGTTAYQPPRPSPTLELARGYEWRGGRQVALPLRFTHASPSGGLTTTASDMARVMLALLGDGSVDGQRVLSEASVKAMLAPQYTPDQRIPATAYGMTHWLTHGQRLLHKDGTLGDQIGVMVLAPASGLGIFAVSNALPGVANQLLEPLLTHLFGPETPAVPPVPMSVTSDTASRAVGTYRDFHHTRNDMSRPISLMLQSRVSAQPDGAIRWRDRRWVEVAPLVFTSTDGRDTIVFREDASGKIVTLHAWGATYERIGWAQQVGFHAAFLAACVVAFLAYPLSRGVAILRRRPSLLEGRTARRCAVVVALANLAFIVWLGLSLRGLGASVPLAPATIIWLSVPLVSAAMTALLPGCAAMASREGWWTFRERVSYAAFAAVSVAFMVFLNYWKVLGIRY